MTKIRKIKFALLAIFILIPLESGFSCSMYKITVNGKTIVGCNEDAWRLTPHIWFENALNPLTIGAAFTGSRFDGPNGYAPQSGMNEYGLTYSRLASRSPENNDQKRSAGLAISNPTQYLKDILHLCKTVEDVKAYISRYDHSYFMEDVFIYIDKSGRYLVVEPFTMTIGNDAKDVLSNFCPSVTSQETANKLDRYRNGVEFLKNGMDTSLQFTTALSDAMHVCREKIGDGTLLTSIWDTDKGNVNLYFYHQYKKTVQFNLKEELAKGDHIIAVDTLFPTNTEFEKLRDYKIPQNNNWILLFMLSTAMLSFFTAFFFLVRYFRKRQSKYALLQLALFPVGLLLFYYMFVLCTNMGIFYFSSPYKDSHNIFVSITSYIPYLLLLAIIPLIMINLKIFKEKLWDWFAKWLFALNNIVYVILIGLFAYWGFYF